MLEGKTGHFLVTKYMSWENLFQILLLLLFTKIAPLRYT